MKKHQRTHKNEIVPKHGCRLCNISFTHNEDFQTQHPHEQSFELINHAFEKSLRIYNRNIRAKASDTSCLWPIFQIFKNFCKRIIVEDFPVMKFNLCLFGIFEKLSPEETEHETKIFALKSTHFTIKPHTKPKNIWSSIIKSFDDRNDEYLLNCLAFHYLKKEYPSIKRTLSDASQHRTLYQKFIDGLNFKETSIFKPYNKPIGI